MDRLDAMDKVQERWMVSRGPGLALPQARERNTSLLLASVVVSPLPAARSRHLLMQFSSFPEKGKKKRETRRRKRKNLVR